MELLQNAIQTVKSSKYSFCKFVSANDAGSTGGHQAGIYIPKNSYKLLFDKPGVKGQNIERIAEIVWQNGAVSQCSLKYYGGGTRNEYRMTRLGTHFSAGEFVIICKLSESKFCGFKLVDRHAVDQFLLEFGISEDQVNSLIPNGRPQEESDCEEDEIEELRIDNTLPASQNTEAIEASFRPKAHILTLLGEELIKDPVMAIYELIKNSYDADSKSVAVHFNSITDNENASIVVIDSGTGMTEEVLQNVWLEPGTAFRKPLDTRGKRMIVRSPIFNRIPMGEKGVGRFAVHKLGSKIKLISRPCEIIVDEEGKFKEKRLLNYEVMIEIDWNSFTQSKYLSDVRFEFVKNYDLNSFYFKDRSGTYIKISGLKESWNRGMARDLKRHALAMTSPKNDPEKFQIDLNFYNNWLDKYPNIDELLNQAPYKLDAIVDQNYNLVFEYQFNLVNNPTIGSRRIKGDPLFDRNILGSLRPMFREYYERRGIEQAKIEELLGDLASKPLPFGGVMIELYSFDLDAASLRDVTLTPDILRRTLKEQHGVRIYKDDLRVYDYGESGNDWLGLDLRRVNNKEWFSNNQNIGFIYLDSSSSGSLVEKTNREGFLKNESFDLLLIVAIYLLDQFRIERWKDREQWLRLNAKAKNSSFRDRVSNFASLVHELEIQDTGKKERLLQEAENLELDYEKAQETLLVPAGVGMTASVALHEIEKLVPRMEETVETEPINPEKIRSQVEELDEYVSGILSVLKQAGTKPTSIRETIEQALRNYQLKLKVRKINVLVDVGEDIGTFNCDKRYAVTMLMNLIDNSIYWLDTVYKDNKTILVKAFKSEARTHIIVADNGPGFKDSPSEIVTPFFTRKAGGIGIGMYLVDTIMTKYGKLVIYNGNDEVIVPPLFTGAIVELVFSKNQ